MSWNWFTSEPFLSLAPIVIASGTALAGIFTYWQRKKNETLTQIVQPILTEYKKDLQNADIAVDILNDYPYVFKYTDDPKAFNLYSGRISKTDLPLVLRNDTWVDTSPVEDKVIRSFDALLYFFAELEYIVQLGLLKRSDLMLFKYEIDKVVKEEAIRNFVNIHRLSFNGRLNDNLKLKGRYLNIVGNEAEQFRKLQGAGYEQA
jgi:hypothetical protein